MPDDLNALKIHSLIANQPSVDPSTYEELGQEVVKLALATGMELSDAAVDVLKGYPHFNATQVGNVCWSANNECFRKLAERRKEEQAPDLMFEFGLADPPDVLKRLDKQASPPEKTLPDADYLSPPVGATDEVDDDVLKQAFSYVEGAEINQDVPVQNPYAKITEMREAVEHVKESCVLKMNQLEYIIDEAEDSLYKQIKSAALQGVPLSHVTTLLAQREGEQAVIDEFQKIAGRLVEEDREGFYFLQKAASLEPSIEGLPNTDHELFQVFGGLRDARREYLQTKTARSIAERDYARLQKVEWACMNYLNKRQQES